MKKYIFLILGVYVTLLTFQSTLLAKTPITLVAGENYPPYHGTMLKNGGPAVEVTKAAFRLSGYEAKIKFYPWTRAYKQALNGSVVGIIAMWHRKDREKHFKYTHSVGKDSTCFIKRSDFKFKYNKLSDIKGLKVGIAREYSYPKEFEDIKYIKRIKGVDDEEIIRFVDKKIVDIGIVSKHVAQYEIVKKLGYNPVAFDFLEPCLVTEYFYNAISKKHPNYQELVSAFNKGLEKLRRSGALKKILMKHGKIIKEDQYGATVK